MRKAAGYRLRDLAWLITSTKSDTYVRELALELTYELAFMLGRMSKALDELAGVLGHMPAPVREQAMSVIEEMAGMIGRMSEGLDAGE